MEKKKIFVRIVPNSKVEEISQEPDGALKVRVKAPAKENKANERLIELLADHFNVPKNSINIKLGAKAKIKIVEIIK